jgi:hypothetical protein
MAHPTTRATLIDYCLQQLGEPVIEINVDEDQLDDRIDDALQYWQEYHSDASKKVYISHKITATDKTNKYITLPDEVLWVERMLPLDMQGTNFLYNVEYHMRLSDLNRLTTMGGIAQYEQMQQALALYDLKLGTGLSDPWRFSRHEHKLFIDVDDSELVVDKYIMISCYSALTGVAAIYNDRMLKKYSTALIKRQWGSNLIKFDGMVLPGGVTLNGRQIYDDAIQDIERIEEKIALDYEMPTNFYMG